MMCLSLVKRVVVIRLARPVGVRFWAGLYRIDTIDHPDPSVQAETFSKCDYEEELHRHYLRDRYWHTEMPGLERKELVGHH